MKRSEMLKELTLKIEMHQSDGFAYDIRSEDILKWVEDLGMVPPEIDSGIYIRSECANAWVHEWEPEDG